MTPHVSGWTEGRMEARAAVIAENIHRGEHPSRRTSIAENIHCTARGEPPVNLVR
jgi:phosphoglycerate dehydrogenase-like enzyme